MHLVLNLAVVSLYVVNLWLRTTRAPEATLPIVLSAIGLVLLVSAGWLTESASAPSIQGKPP
jgi:hypothetical protein